MWKETAILTYLSRNMKVDTIYNHSITTVIRSRFSFHKAALKLRSLKLSPSDCAKRCSSPPSLPDSCLRSLGGKGPGRGSCALRETAFLSSSHGWNDLPHYITILTNSAFPVINFVLSFDIVELQINCKFTIMNKLVIFPCQDCTTEKKQQFILLTSFGLFNLSH